MMRFSLGMVFYNIYWLIITCLLDVIIIILDGMVRLLMFNLIWARVLTNQELTSHINLMPLNLRKDLII